MTWSIGITPSRVTAGQPGCHQSQRGRRPVRKVPIPPELVTLLREHIERFGVRDDGRLFRSGQGNVIQPSTWWQVWQKVRARALTEQQRAPAQLTAAKAATVLLTLPVAQLPLA